MDKSSWTYSSLLTLWKWTRILGYTVVYWLYKKWASLLGQTVVYSHYKNGQDFLDIQYQYSPSPLSTATNMQFIIENRLPKHLVWRQKVFFICKKVFYCAKYVRVANFTDSNSFFISLEICGLLLNIRTGSVYLPTVCPWSLDPFYVISYGMKWVKTSWTCSTTR